MEKIVNFFEREKATSGDMRKTQDFARQAFDHLVSDAIEPQNGYTGLNAVKTAQTIVTVGAGRLYAAGKVFFRDDEGGVAFDFLSDLPSTAKRIALLCVRAPSQTLDTATEPREFLINPQTRQTEAQPVSTENWRLADLSRVLGSENPNPASPAVDAAFVPFAIVTLNTTSVESVAMIDANRLLSLRTVRTLLLILQNQFGAYGTQLETLGSDLSRVSNAVDQAANKDAIYRAFEDIARLKQTANLPDTFIDYGADNFLDLSESDTLATGYDAKVREGLRFPETTSVRQLALVNPQDAGVSISSNVLLPKFSTVRWREVIPASGEIALNSLNYDTATIVVANMSNIRSEFGAPMLISESSAWWQTSQWSNKALGILQRNGEEFVALETNQVDPLGLKIFRVQKRWATYVSSPYWTLNSNPAGQVVAGFQWAQTFLATQDMWVAGLGFHFTRLDSTGDVKIGLCEVNESGQPDYGKVIATATHPRSALKLAPGPSQLSIAPTYLKSGKQYAAFVITAANHWLSCTDSRALNGTLFLRTGGNYWTADPSKNFLMDLFIAKFEKPRTEVQFEPVSLAGGIAALDIIMQSIVPESAGITWQAQVGGVWKDLDPDEASPFVGLPELVNIRAVMTGTTAMQPALIMPGSQVTASRPKLGVKHVSSARTLPSASSSIRLKARLQNFNESVHDATLKINVGGTEIAASVVSDRDAGNGVIERKAIFTLGSPTSSFKRVFIGAATNVNNQYVVPEVTDVAV